MTNQEVISRFAARKINRRTGQVTGQGFSIVANGRALLDRGHWPLAFYLGKCKGEPVFLKQGDHYSRSTSQHQGMVQKACKGPTISFSALLSANIRSENITLAMVRDYQTEGHVSLQRKDKDSPWQERRWNAEPIPFKSPDQGMLIKTGEDSGYWHTLGGVLLQVGTRYLYCGLDERTYFISELRYPARTVQSALNGLKPRRVQQAETAITRGEEYTIGYPHGEVVKRQGEWFFVPTLETDASLAVKLGMTVTNFRYYQTGYGVLPDPRQRQGRAENFHHTKWCEVDGRVYAKGKVYHRTGRKVNSRLTREHSTLRLGETWHRVYRNTERRSWSQGGRFD